MKKRFQHLYLEITNQCQLYCPFCYLNNDNPRFITLDTLDKILPQFTEYTDTVYLHVLGEPLMHPDFPQIVEKIESNGINIKITTNGVLLNRYHRVFSQSKAIKRVNISFQALLGIPRNRWSSHLNQLVTFINNGPYHFPICLRIWLDQEELIDVAKDFLLEYFNFTNFTNNAKIKEGVYLSILDSFTWPTLNDRVIDTPSKCLGTVTHLAVLSNLTVTMCCLDPYAHTNLGNLNEQTFSEIVESEKFQKLSMQLRQGIISEELCKRCSYRLRFNKKPK